MLRSSLGAASLALALAVAPTLVACAADSAAPDPASKENGITTVSPAGAVTSPNAVPGTRYMDARSISDLKALGALSPELVAVLARINGICWTVVPGCRLETLSRTALSNAEQPAQYATFFPAEQALFPKLWSILAIDPAVDLAPPLVFAQIETIAPTIEPDPLHLDELQPFAIADLPGAMQTLAARLPKAASTPGGSVTYADVELAASAPLFTPAEREELPAMLRAVSAKQLTPATFPHVEITEPLNQMKDIALGTANLHVERWGSTSCAEPHAYVTTSVSMKIAVPPGAVVAALPLSDGQLGVFDPSNPRAAPPTFTGTSPLLDYQAPNVHKPFVVLFETWSAGARTAQVAVSLPTSSYVDASRHAIVENGTFTCMPSRKREEVLLPPGRYPFSAGTYGTGYLDIYGFNVVRSVIGGKSLFVNGIESPTAGGPDAKMCSNYTAGATNLVTGEPGAGPGVQFLPGAATVAYQVHANDACGAPVAGAIPLTAAMRL